MNLAAAAKGRGRTKMYRVLHTARLRNGFELDSELIGSLEPGDVLRVLEERQNENGVVRVRCSRGWTSVDGRNGGMCDPTHQFICPTVLAWPAADRLM